MTPESDRLLGPLTHLGGETLAGCEMEPNKVAAEVTVRPVTPPQQPVTVDGLRTGGAESIVHLQDHSGLRFYRLMLLCCENAKILTDGDDFHLLSGRGSCCHSSAKRTGALLTTFTCACVIFGWDAPADPGWEAKIFARGQK